MYEDHLEFLELNSHLSHAYEFPERFSYDWVMYQSRWPWLELDLEVPFEEMFQEATALKDKFVSHRFNDAHRGYKHHNWRSVCLHGIDAFKTENFHAYGFRSQEEAPYGWTEIASHCPVSVRFIKSLPFENLYRVRFMWLGPGGYIHPHRDQEDFSFYPINIALNNPEGCNFVMDGKGILPFAPGKAFHMNLAYTHSVFNDSQEPRIHMIIHAAPGAKKPKHEELLRRSYDKLKRKQDS